MRHLCQRHPHEDAFILFRYAEHLAGGQGIVFNPGGPPAEGATDFLYLVLVALGVRFGVDVAIAAIVLNVLGSGLIALVYWQIVATRTPSWARFSVGLCLAAAVPFLGGAHASYEGFGTQLYCALAALGYAACVGWTPRAVRNLPYLALALGLFRPDGVILGVGFWTCAVMNPRLRDVRPALLRHGVIAVALAGLYFAWRVRYFGELLPLPLYVKARGPSALPGLALNREWFLELGGPGPLLVALTACVVALRVRHGVSSLGALTATLPAWALLVALGFAQQSQNVDWRFQAPLYTVLSTALLACAAPLADRVSARARVLVAVVTAIAFVPALARGKRVWPHDYMDTFAVKVARAIDHRRIVVTEAGRLAYWTDARVHDLIGLNSPHSARFAPTIGFVESLAPDVVLLHAAGTLDLTRAFGGPAQDVTRLAPEHLRRAVHPPFRRFLGRQSDAYQPGDVSTKLAPVVLADYLSKSRDFDLFAVKYGGAFNHLVAVKKHQPFTEPVVAALHAAQHAYVPYAEAKGWACASD